MQKIALLIGVSEYQSNALSPLPAAVRDIKALGEVLIHPELGGFPKSHVTLLENPGRLDMEIAIESLFEERHRDDLVLFFFSGHGIKDDTGRLYLATFETRKAPTGRLQTATAVAADTVHRYMEYSRSRRQIVILDSCFSGAFPAGLSLKDDGKIDLRAQLGGEGRAILTSSSSTQYSFQQNDEELSLYTRFLIRGIETGEADRDGKGIITIGELHDYARQKVQEVQPAMNPEIYPGKEGSAIHISQAPLGDPEEKYAKEVTRSVNRRGKIASVAARANLNDWRGRLGLDPATCEAIEKEIMMARWEEFQKKQQEYAQVIRQILEGAGNLETEAAHLQRRREMLELTEEDAKEIQTVIEQEIAARRQRHERNLQRYTVLFAEAIRQEGPLLSDETQAEMASIQQVLNLPDKAVEQIQIREINANVRREETKITEPPMISTALTEETVHPALNGLDTNYANWRMLWKIQAHAKPIAWPHGLEFAPDGRTVLSGSWDNTLALWVVESSQAIRTFRGHSANINSATFSPDGKALLSGSSDTTLKLWDVESGRELRTFNGHSDYVLSVAFSQDGHTVLSGSNDDTLKLWDVASGQELRTFEGHSNSVNSVAFAPDGKALLSGSDNNTLKLWDVASGKEIRTFLGHFDLIYSVAFAPDGRTLLSGSADKTLKLWDVASGQAIRTFKEHSDEVNSVAFAPDGRTALSGSDDKTLKVWDVASGQAIRTLEGHSNKVWSVAFSPDGQRAASGDHDGVMILWGEE